MPAWRDWFHLMTNTYGTWLPGDPRGFRTRQHREHVDGDYRQPPAAREYGQRHDRARGLMKRGPVYLSPAARRVAVDAFRRTMADVHGQEVLAIAVTRMHVHILVRLPGKKPTAIRGGLRGSRGLRETDPARYYMGVAKERAAKSLATQALVAPGGVWARRGKVKPICNRAHQVRVFHYILDHIEKGGAVWSFREPRVVRMKGDAR